MDREQLLEMEQALSALSNYVQEAERLTLDRRVDYEQSLTIARSYLEWGRNPSAPPDENNNVIL